MAKKDTRNIANEVAKDKKLENQLNENSKKASGEITQKELTDNELDSVTGGGRIIILDEKTYVV